MIEVTLDKDAYTSHLADLDKRAADQPAWLRELRRSAFDRYSELGFPKTSDEEWRFTNLAPIASGSFQPARNAKPAFDLARLEAMTFSALNVIRIVCVNGRYAPELSSSGSLPDGLKVESLAAAIQSRPEEVHRHLGRYVQYENQAFAALNTAFIEDGVYITIPKGAVIDAPVHVIHATGAEADPIVNHQRTLIVAGESSRATIVESYLGRGKYFSNAVTEIVGLENAVVDHYRLQREAIGAYHTSVLEMNANRNANLSSQAVSIGGALVRNDVGVVLDGEGAHGTINGLSVVTGTQHVDNHTSIDHAKPNCTSHELYKGVLSRKAHIVFNGRIRVRKDAQKTDSKQTNNNLLLSDQCLVNTNPQLEIYADDVKCTHGATIGQLDENALFYLRSRGIDYESARHILTYAFAAELVERIRIPELKAQLDELFVHRLRDDDGVEETL